MTNPITLKDLEARLKAAKQRARDKIKLEELHDKLKQEEYGIFKSTDRRRYLTRSEKATIFYNFYSHVFNQEDVSEDLIRDYIVHVGSWEMLFGQSYQAARDELHQRAEGRTFVR